MSKREDELCVDVVNRVSKQSRARRLQVGAMLVNDGVWVVGYNGTPAGWDNNCEDMEEMPIGGNPNDYPIEEIFPVFGMVDKDNNLLPLPKDLPNSTTTRRYRLKTKSEVVHAEMNVFKKVANNPNIIKGGTLFVTHAPCTECAKLFIGMGLNRLVYLNKYRSDDGINMLRKDNISIEFWNKDAQEVMSSKGLFALLDNPSIPSFVPDEDVKPIVSSPVEDSGMDVLEAMYAAEFAKCK